MKKKGQHVSITTFKRTHNVSPDVIKRRRLSFVRLQFVTVQGNKFKLHSTNKRFRLAKTCVYLRCLAMTCDRFNGAQFCPQVAVRFSPLDHRTQVVASDQKLFSVLLALIACTRLRRKGNFTTSVYWRARLANRRKFAYRF